MKQDRFSVPYFGIALLLLVFSACDKKVVFQGSVLSKHKFPVSGAKVLLQVGDMYGSMRNDTDFEGITNEEGDFEIKGEVCRKCFHSQISVWSDSGFVEHKEVNDPMQI